MFFYIISSIWLLLSFCIIYQKIKRRQIIFKTIRENKEVILKNINKEIKDSAVVEISKEELKATKESFINLIKPHIGSNEIDFYEKQMNLGTEFKQLDYLNSILNSSGATKSVTFVFKSFNQ